MRLAHALVRVIPTGYAETNDLAHGNRSNTSVEAIGQILIPLSQEMLFSHENNRFLPTVRTFRTFLEITVTLDWYIVHVFFFF